ncbi:hypothetical protein QY049_35605 [Bradyrhizobium sp. WYCCWR 13022]|uniref:hypothetical protein n=1 Tax=unclassified Bradyrhizobium TaxID=2631580 RepID=UPI00263A41A4|nr:hypothetical protein [Bradyrhizobium sp. WYCCWR 13022]MDN4988477.1 hypothetical protein [Bradyrhizobium sp. WYCCWR 13022]
MRAPRVRKSSSAVTSGRTRLPAALKHGAFAKVELLPWEDPAAYEQLRQEFLEEFEPEGILQHECVRDILMATWRKQRLRDRRNAEMRAVLLQPQNRVFDKRPGPLLETSLDRVMYGLAKASSEEPDLPRDDYERLLNFSSSLTHDAAPKVVAAIIGCLPKEYRTHLQTHIVRDKFEEAHLWIVALKKEVDGVLLPKVRERRPDPDGYLAAAADLLAPDKMLEDVAIEERLDAQIDRALRRLFWLKTQKKLDRESKQKIVDAKVN